jgi:hypothetical protein
MKAQVIVLLRERKLSPEQIASRLTVPYRTVTAIQSNLTRGAYDEKEMSLAEREKWRAAQRAALKTSLNAKQFTKYCLAKAGYRWIDLDTKLGYEYKGIVDLVAIKRDKKDPDSLRIVLFQVKGGGARIKGPELIRLRNAASRIKVEWNYTTKPRTAVVFGKAL